ncbi:MAG: pantoate kinase [Candidatus Poribacteria bacterium]
MEQARAFAPGNISCMFKIIPHEDPTRMHSLGMGFTVKEGATVTVSQDSKISVLFNGDEICFPTVVSVVQKLTPQPMRIEIVSPLPLGCGFGLSGASALATAYALNKLLGLGKSEKDLAMTAHVAEVENLTGLGDICAQYHGGCLVKLRVGHPLAARRLPIPEQPVYYRYFGLIRTKEVLGNAAQKERINRAADAALRGIEELMKSNSINFNECIKVSKSFALNSGLLKDRRVQRVIQQIENENGFASMIMLGNAVFSTQPFAGAKETMLSIQRGKVL